MKNPITFLPGTKPGNDKAVKQHQAMGQGYIVNDDKQYDIKLNNKKMNGVTGTTECPGLTTKRKKAK